MALLEHPLMSAALAEARAAAARGEVPVGAVLARDGTIVARAGNRVEASGDPTAHAELLVLRAAGRAMGRHALGACDLFVTLEPCPMCAHAIVLARVQRLYYGATDPKGGGVEHGPMIFHHAGAPPAPEVYGGVGEQAAADLLRAFFRSLRSRTGPAGRRLAQAALDPRRVHGITRTLHEIDPTSRAARPKARPVERNLADAMDSEDAPERDPR